MSGSPSHQWSKYCCSLYANGERDRLMGLPQWGALHCLNKTLQRPLLSGHREQQQLGWRLLPQPCAWVPTRRRVPAEPWCTRRVTESKLCSSKLWGVGYCPDWHGPPVAWDHAASVHRSTAQARTGTHTQLGYIFEANSYAPNWIKTKIKLYCLSSRGLCRYTLGADVHETAAHDWNLSWWRLSWGLASALRLLPDAPHAPWEQSLTSADKQSQQQVFIENLSAAVLSNFPYIFLPLTCGMDIFIIPIFQGRRPKLREVERLVQDSKTSRWKR